MIFFIQQQIIISLVILCIFNTEFGLNSLFGKSQPAMKINPSLYFDYEEGDTRRDVAICTYAVDNNTNIHLHPYGGFYIGKFRPSWKTTVGTKTNKRDINWPWFRYSHILLMYAEASNEYNNGPDAAAQAALREIRLRAFGGDASKVGNLRTVIWQAWDVAMKL